MPSYIALLRAVNVGGTGRLPMADLRALCAQAGFAAPRTYIASGNVVFETDLAETAIIAALTDRLTAYAGREVGVLVRSAAEMAAVVAANPFAEAPGNRVMALFLPGAPTAAMLLAVTGQTAAESLALGAREIYVHYAAGQGASTLVIPAARVGTARNLNTVAALAAMAGG